jgi:hypothetical protein
MLEAIDKYAGGVFNPDDVRILVAAFDNAWQSLLASGITFESDRESKAVRDRLAKYIIEKCRDRSFVCGHSGMDCARLDPKALLA